jgi:hypothetical protein
VIEKQLEQSMHAALAGEPPLGFDPDDVVDRAARRHRQRRAFAVVAAMAGVVGLATATLLVAGGSDGAPTATAPDAVCETAPPGAHAPPEGFPGSDAIVARLRAAEPGLLAEHVPGTTFDPPEGVDMGAFDCPPFIAVSRYVSGGTGESLALQLTHRRDRLDLAGDPYADDLFHRLVGDKQAADGARIRVYREKSPLQPMLAVVRFGPDGMITEASVIAADARTITEDQLTALATDPELRFPLPR